MKKLIVCLVLLFGLIPFAFTQDNLKLSRLTASMGKGAFTSGFDVTAIFENSLNLMEITANHERFYAVYFWKLPLKIKAGIFTGAFKNMPQAGPYVIVSPTKFLSVFYWRGWRAGEPEKPRAKIQHFFQTTGASMLFGGLKIDYVWIDFLGEKTSLPGICYTFAINSRFKCFAGVDYKVSEKMPLFRIGLSYFPEKKIKGE